jgi:L-threonylcarbamoyladenylate synthase
MKTELLLAARRVDIERAAAILRGGGVVAFPTETVYGLGARGDLPEAVEELYRVKGRPSDKRSALLIGPPEEAGRFAALGPTAVALIEAFWPGPLTLVLPDGHGGYVGLRCPDHPVTLELVRLAGAPLIAPSANVSGQPPATDARQVLAAFDGRIAAVLDGGPARLGVASTVVRVLEERMEILRPGAIPEGRFQEALARARRKG